MRRIVIFLVLLLYSTQAFAHLPDASKESSFDMWYLIPQEEPKQVVIETPQEPSQDEESEPFQAVCQEMSDGVYHCYNVVPGVKSE